LFILSFTLIGCAKQPQGHTLTIEEKEQMGRPNYNDLENADDSEEAVVQQNTPIWADKDLAAAKVINESEENAEMAHYERTIELKPKFYEGPMPFKYDVIYAPGKAPYEDGGILSNRALPLYYDFGGFVNFFVSDESNESVIGACTKENKILVAEARLFSDGSNSDGKLEIEEFHYNSDGNLIFQCKSQFDPIGFKIAETEATGIKIKDYYFLWPAMNP